MKTSKKETGRTPLEQLNNFYLQRCAASVVGALLRCVAFVLIGYMLAKSDDWPSLAFSCIFGVLLLGSELLAAWRNP